MTTPLCFENVHWIIDHKAKSISKTQLEDLKNKGTYQISNYREIQALNSRNIQANFQYNFKNSFSINSILLFSLLLFLF
jgi:carbonic anhydrase